MEKWKGWIRNWRVLSLLQVAAVAGGLALIGEQYPFSDFPMYSHLDDHSDVLFVTDLQDRVLPMEELFATSSSTQKKVFITELKALCNPEKRDTRDARPDEKMLAGRRVLARLMERRDADATPKDAKGLRLYYKEFTFADGRIHSGDPQRVAEVTL
jgi:hypothetical protein